MSLAPPSPISTSPVTARRILLLGGIRSGKSTIAEALVADALTAGASSARYIATAHGDPEDPAWTSRLAAHRARRPPNWTTVEVGASPDQLSSLLTGAAPSEALLVDDLGGWLTAVFETTGRWDDPAVCDEWGVALAEAVSVCSAARLVLVSPEVGLSVIPATETGRTFADAQGSLNRRTAAACDAVALVVAGRTLWLPATVGATGTDGTVTTTESLTIVATSTVAATASDAADGPGTVIPAATAADDGVPAATAAEDDGTLAASGDAPTQEIPGWTAPVPEFVMVPPDEGSADQAEQRLQKLDVPGAGLGTLTSIVRFAAAVQGRPDPQPWRRIRALLLRGDHAGGVCAGDSPSESARRLADATAGRGALALLADRSDVQLIGVDCPASGAIEHGDALAGDAVESAIAHGRRLADEAVDEGVDLLVLGSCGAGTRVTATAVAVLYAGGEAAHLLPRATLADGRVDDAAWMRRCIALRDGLFRVRNRPRDGRTVLATLGGGELAVATGVLLGAALRRTPVLIDGPVGAAAALVARDLAALTPRWLLLPDTGGHPTVQLCATVLCLEQLMDLKLGLGDGSAALTALPVLQTALHIASTIRSPEVATSAEGAPGDVPHPPAAAVPSATAAPPGDSEQ